MSQEALPALYILTGLFVCLIISVVCQGRCRDTWLYRTVRNFINAVPYTAIDDDEDDDSSLHSSSDHTGTTERLHALEGGFNNTNNEFLAESLQNIESMLTTSQQSDDSSNVNRQRADHFLSQTMDYRGRRIWGEEAWTQGIGPNGRPLQEVFNLSPGEMFEFRQHASNYLRETEEGERMPEYLKNGCDLETSINVPRGNSFSDDESDLSFDLHDLPCATQGMTSSSTRVPPFSLVPPLETWRCARLEELQKQAPRGAQMIAKKSTNM